MGKKNKVAKQQPGSPAASPVSTAAKKTSTSSGNSSMTSWLIVCVAVLPFLISGKQIDPVVANRFIWLSGFILIFSIVFFLKNKKKLPAPLPVLVKFVFISGIVYTVWAVISSINAVNPYEGYFIITRRLVFLVLLFIVMFLVIYEENNFITIAKTLVIAGLLQSIIGILQFYQTAFTDIPGNFIPYGLMANRNLFGSAQAFLFPFSLLVLLQGNKLWKYTAGVSLTLLAVSVFISQTRSAWLATILTIVTTLLLIIIFSPPLRKQWLTGAVAGIVILFAVFSFVMSTGGNDEFNKSIANRAASFAGATPDSSAEQQNVTERFKIWNKTIRLIKKEPVLGVGPGNWKIIVPTTGTEGTAWEAGFYSPDQVHNDYLQVAAETGIPGALFYFIPWIMIGLMGLQVIIKTNKSETRLLVICMLAGITGFAADAMFSFPNERIEHMVYFSLFCGAILGAYYKFSVQENNKSIVLPKWISYTILVAALFGVFIGFKRRGFETHMKQANIFEKNRQYANMLTEAEAAKNSFITLDPVGKPAEIYSSLGYDNTGNRDQALRELVIAKKYHPNSFMIYNNTGTIYTEQNQFEKAIENYQKALQLAPKLESGLKNLALNYYNLKKFKECITALEKTNWQAEQILVQVYNSAKAQMNAAQLSPALSK